MKRTLALILAMLATCAPAAAAAQSVITYPRAEWRLLAGLVDPGRGISDVLENAPSFAMQAGFELKPYATIVASVSWSNQHTRLALSDRKATIYQLDLGYEYNVTRALRKPWRAKPFVGFGYGTRIYDYADVSVDNAMFAAGYGLTGAEVQVRAVALRVEVRSEWSRYHEPTTPFRWRTGFDLVASGGVVVHVF